MLLIFKCIIKGLKPIKLLKADYGLKNGGIGEVSKHFDYQQFNKNYFLKHIFLERNISTNEKIKKIESFTKYPLVVKPDNGRTGKGVLIAKNRKELKYYLQKSELDIIAQVYSSKKEYGVFYYKLNNKGAIYSINSKELPYVIGDGKSSVRQLIEKEHNHIKEFIPPNINQNYVAKRGEKFKVSYIGNHSHGAIFRDATHLSTQKLLQSIEKSIGNAGFNYGRFDVVCDNDKTLKEGKIKIIEVNGVHSFSTNFLDPKYSLIDAYKIINKQYNILLKVALENKHKPMKLPTLINFIKLTRSSESSIEKINKTMRS